MSAPAGCLLGGGGGWVDGGERESHGTVPLQHWLTDGETRRGRGRAGLRVQARRQLSLAREEWRPPGCCVTSGKLFSPLGLSYPPFPE